MKLSSKDECLGVYKIAFLLNGLMAMLNQEREAIWRLLQRMHLASFARLMHSKEMWTNTQGDGEDGKGGRNNTRTRPKGAHLLQYTVLRVVNQMPQWETAKKT